MHTDFRWGAGCYTFIGIMLWVCVPSAHVVPAIGQFDHVGEWLSLVEHLVRDQGVGGSNPLAPTNYPADGKALPDPPPSARTGAWVLFGSNKRFNCDDTRSTARRRSRGTDIT